MDEIMALRSRVCGGAGVIYKVTADASELTSEAFRFFLGWESGLCWDTRDPSVSSARLLLEAGSEHTHTQVGMSVEAGALWA